jgi:hypothetical protein
MIFQALAYFLGYALTGFLTTGYLQEDAPVIAPDENPESASPPVVDEPGFLDSLAEPWRIAIFLQCGLLIPLILLIMSTPNKYFEL